MKWTRFHSAALVLLSVASIPVDAHAQLRGGVGGVPTLGTVAPSGGNTAAVAPNLGGIDPQPRQPLNQSNNPDGNATRTANGVATAPQGNSINTVTNTLSGTVPGVVSNSVNTVRRGVTGSAVDSVNRLDRNALSRSSSTKRSGVPPAGERRFVANEVVIGLPSNLSSQSLDELMRRHGLTR